MSKILDLLTGILPVKNKGNGYYLEFKEEDEAKSPEASKPAEPNGAKPAADTSATSGTPVSNGKTAENTEAEPKSKKVSIKERKKVEKAKKAQPASSPKTVSSAPEPVETNFATKYLMPTSTNGRRRPGANMNSFLEMARTVKTPIK